MTHLICHGILVEIDKETTSCYSEKRADVLNSDWRTPCNTVFRKCMAEPQTQAIPEGLTAAVVFVP